MRKIIYIILLIVFLFIAIAGSVYYKKNSRSSDLDFPKDELNNDSGDFYQKLDIVAPVIKNIDDGYSTYIHKKYGFSFEFPSHYITSNFQEGNGELIIFNSSNNDWFQIYITLWDEGDIITSERINEDLPELVILNPQNVILGPGQKDGVGPRALIFFSKDGKQETREIWFVVNNHLYQIQTYKRLDSMIGKVLSTLIFK